MEKISPRVDIAFKKIFGVEENKDLLISLINAVVSEEDQVCEITLLNPYNPKNFRKDKLSILDIKATGQDGKRFNIEIQISDEADYNKRALYYWAKLYTEQLKEAEDYKTRALREIAEAKEHLQKKFLETAASTAYYSCFYSVHSQLARLGVMASSHKQAGIEFRRHFVRTNLLDKKYSRVWSDLSKWRSLVDYTALPIIDMAKAKELVEGAEDFVTTLLAIKV